MNQPLSNTLVAVSTRGDSTRPIGQDLATPGLQQISNERFLETVFKDLQPQERPIVVCIPDVINKDTFWGVGNSWAPKVTTDLNYVRDDEANWFFTLSTYLPEFSGQYRRTKAQFHRAYGVMLDDIGTKSAGRERLEACPPSYLIETSPGNYQAGYLFKEPQESLERVTALQESLVATGLCDPGAKGPASRLGRLPCGYNGKYEPAPMCRLVEWHPERRYTLAEIEQRLQLQPPVAKSSKKPSAGASGQSRIGPSSSSSSSPGSSSGVSAGMPEAAIFEPRASENAVITALRTRGLYKRVLGDGKHDITCPWAEEHTDGLDTAAAYFEPSADFALGGFKCLHSHGERFHIRNLLSFLGLSLSAARHKTTIRMIPGEMDRVVDAAEQALALRGQYYQYGGLIVRVVRETDTNNDIIKAISPNTLTRALSICASWERFDARASEFVVSDPGTKYVKVLHEAEQYVHLPLLKGLARQPYLRPDGSLMRSAGYDPLSGMYGVFDPTAFSVPEQPSRAQAEAALGQLQQLLTEFSFAKPHDRAAALAGMLTAAIRPSLPLAPMLHIKAPQIASGKSYLSGLIAAFAGPTTPSAYTFPSNDEECSKLLLSALLTGPAVVIFDNLTTDLFPYKSMCSALTEEHLTGRILGVSKTATVGTRTMFLSSGNNVAPIADMTRRVLTITLDPACETPATRRFSGDPLGQVQRQRAMYVGYALTIVQAYVQAGYPLQSLQPINSFGRWTQLVRSALVWLGVEDPATAIFESMNDDPDTETLGRILVIWHSKYKDQPTPIRDALGFDYGDRNQELRELLREVGEFKGQVSSRRIGRWIARKEGRLVNGMRFERDANKTGGSERWRVVVMGDKGATADLVESDKDDDWDLL